MVRIQELNRCITYLRSSLLPVALVCPMPLLLAQSGEAAGGPQAGIPTRAETGQQIVKAKDLIEALKGQGGEVDFSYRTIEGNLDLYEIPATKDTATGEDTIVIKRPLRFYKTVFEGAITTWNQDRQLQEGPPVKFLSKVNFVGAQFEDHVNMDGAVFQDSSSFGDAHFEKMASFTEATFKNRVSFRSAQFDERALFKETRFDSETDFALATFNWLAFFREAEFRLPKSSKGANFLYTKFYGETIFAKARFVSTARFVGTRFHGPTYFSQSTFEDQAWFVGAGIRFDDNVTFKDSRFLKTGTIGREKQGKSPRPPVLFSGIVFSGDASFSGAEFRHVSFGEMGEETDTGLNTIFRGKADFGGARFQSVDLQGVVFQSQVNLTGADFGKKIDFTNTDITDAAVNMEWRQLLRDGQPRFEWQGGFQNGRYKEKDGQVNKAFFGFLSTLEKNFQERGNLDDAREVHFLKEDLKRRRSGGLSYIANTIFSKWIYGYGVRPWHQLWASLVFVAGFAFVYFQSGALLSDGTKGRKLGLRLTEMPIDWSGEKEAAGISTSDVEQPAAVLQRYRRAFRFSFSVFVKIGYGGLYAKKKYKYVVVTEWVLGFVLWVLFVINLSNSWPFLYRVVKMLS